MEYGKEGGSNMGRKMRKPAAVLFFTSLLLSAAVSSSVFALDQNGNADDWPDAFEQAKAVECNMQVEGVINSRSDVEVISFTTDGGQNAYTVNVSAMDTTSYSVGVYDEFYGAGNTIDGGSFIASSGKTTARGFASLSPNKTYYVKIVPRSASSGRWKLLIAKTADDAGNDFSSAKAFKEGQKVTGTFEVDQDIDFYSFTTGKKKRSYWIDFHNMQGASQIGFALYATAGDLSSRVGTEVQIYPAHNAERSFKLSPGRTYYLKVFGAMEGSSYSFKISPSAKTIKKQAPSSFKVESNYSRSVYVGFENNLRYDGVEIWRSTNKKSGFKKIKVLSNDYVDFDDTKTKKNVTYYYKARYYVKEGKKKVYGKWTKVKGGKHKY